MSTANMPDDLVVMGYVAGAFGVRGAVRIVADTEYDDSLLAYPVWWLGRDGQWLPYTLKEGSVSPKGLMAVLEGVVDRDAAFALRGHEVAISRREMPAAAEGEFYWADLEGFDVVNPQEVCLGRVERLFATGANDVLVVKGDKEHLIPFVAAFILSVEPEKKRIVVDWQLDY